MCLSYLSIFPYSLAVWTDVKCDNSSSLPGLTTVFLTIQHHSSCSYGECDMSTHQTRDQLSFTAGMSCFFLPFRIRQWYYCSYPLLLFFTLNY